ncbi:MAG: ABC transporter permease [Dermabacter sp.]|nr:ABC transporter permease [Dermabacter sp.]
MSTDTLTLTTGRAPLAAGGRRSGLARTANYTLASVLMTLRDFLFLFFTIAFPVMMYLFFAAMFGDQADGAARTIILMNMAIYGGLGASMSAGTQLQKDARSGFLRQLTIAGLSPREFLVGCIACGSIVIIPALVVVFAVGAATGAELTVSTFTLGILVLWLALIPTQLIGIALATFLPESAANAASIALLMALAILGGLWFPMDQFPEVMQAIGRLTPAYWVAELGQWAVLGANFPPMALVGIGAWTLALLLVCGIGLRRSVARSARR